MLYLIFYIKILKDFYVKGFYDKIIEFVFLKS